MDALWTAEPITVKPGHPPRWAVKLDGRTIGRVEEVRLRGARNTFYRAVVVIDGDEVGLESNIDFEERCAKVLAAWLDPSSVLQSREWIAARDRRREWDAQRRARNDESAPAVSGE